MDEQTLKATVKRESCAMDVECWPLFFVLNGIRGVETTESCCGHWKDPFMVWMKVDSTPALHALSRSVDIRYGSPSGWSIIVDDTDLPEMPILFRIQSTTRGEMAYSEASAVANCVLGALESKSYKGAFGVEAEEWLGGGWWVEELGRLVGEDRGKRELAERREYAFTCHRCGSFRLKPSASPDRFGVICTDCEGVGLESSEGARDFIARHLGGGRLTGTGRAQERPL